MPRKQPRARKLYTKVNGVTYGNRQRLIRRHCRDGDRLELRPEPRNRHSDHAIGVWARKSGWILRGWRKVGYIPEEDSEEIADLIGEGWKANARIWKVVGGHDGYKHGLRVDVFLIRPEPPPEPVPKPPAPPRGPLIPEPLRRAVSSAAHAGARLAGRILPVVAPPIAAAWTVSWLAGRGRDALGILLIAVLFGAGYYAIRYVMSLKPDNLVDDLLEVEMPESREGE